MSREWKPGDVALDDIERRFMHLDNGQWVGITGTRYWGGELRPLAVIDPEDREQVERLGRAYVETWLGPREEASVETIDQMQAALRNLVTPPKPDEPQGLGAVVEDADGSLMVRTQDDKNPWTCYGGPRWSWDDVDAVRILSEGVQP